MSRPDPEPYGPAAASAARLAERTGQAGHDVAVVLGSGWAPAADAVAAALGAAATEVHGVRTAVAAGCRVVVLTNAAGGIRAGYRVGQPVLIRDHLNLTGRSPLTGPPPPSGYPQRFTDL